MDKAWIVLKSEFVRRVRSKWFIISTLLGPVLLIAMMVLPGLLGYFASETDQRAIVVVDDTGVLGDYIREEAGEQFDVLAPGASVEEIRQSVRDGEYSGYLHLPADLLSGGEEVTYYSAEGGGGLTLSDRLRGMVNRAVERQRLEAEQVSPEVLEILNARIGVEMVKLTDEGEAADAAALSSLVGIIMGFFIYFAMFLYGAYVMQGVMEEKQSRVVEVMVSAVRPFQLLMGKVLGIGLMGLVQMGAWILFLLLGLAFAGSIATLFVDPASLNLPVDASQDEVLQAMDITLPTISPMVFVWFLLFFLGGYLLYASLYAAVGSMVDNQQDAQGLMMPIILLIIIPIMFITFMVETPNSTLSIILSMVPFFSPILMVVRVAVTEVPLWQVSLSFLLLAATFVGSIWLSSRIYRIGILMYGKKPSFKDLARWLRYA